MPETVGEAFVALRAVNDGTFGRDVTKEATTAGDAAGKSMAKSLLTAATATAVGVGIGRFLRGAFDEAQQAQKVGAQTAAVLKSTGEAANVSADAVENLAGELSKKSAVDDEVIQSGENMLLTFKNIRNEQGKGNDIFNQATAVTLDYAAAFANATGSAVDLKGASIQLGKALNDPIAGLTALGKAGVTFSDNQKEQIKNFVESGNLLGAQKIILKEVNSEFGGAAEALATPAEKAQIAIGNFKEAIGTALLPVIEKAADVVTVLADGFSELPGPAQQAVTYLALVGGALVAAGKAAELFGKTKTALSGIADAAKNAGEGTGAMAGKVAGWATVAGLAVGVAYGLSIAFDDVAYSATAAVGKIRQATDRNLDAAVKKLQSVGHSTEITHALFSKLLEQDPAQAERFLAALDRAGEKTGWYKKQLDDVATAEAQSKGATDRHAKSVEDSGGSYDKTNTKIKEQIDLLDKRTQKMDAANNADLQVQSAQLDLVDALNEQFNAFLAAAQAGGMNAEANEALARATIASKQAILEDAQAIRDQVAAHYGGVAGSIAYKQELERLAGTMAPGSPLRVYIEGLITDADKLAGSRHMEFTGDASDLQSAIADAKAALASLPNVPGGNILGYYLNQGAAANAPVDLSFLNDPNNPYNQPGLLTFASGGWVPGSGSGDKVPALLTPGEYVMSKDEIARGMGGDAYHFHLPDTPSNPTAYATAAVREVRRAKFLQVL